MIQRMMNIQRSSPPKVRRSVCLTENLHVVESPNTTPVVTPVAGHKQEVPDSSISMEGMLVDQAVDNLLTLPEVVGQVSEIQKEHHLEVQRNMLHLQQLEAELNQEREKYNGVIQEMANIERKTRMVEETVEEKEKHCSALQKDIEILVSVCENLRHQLRIKKADFTSTKSKYKSYQGKMETHKAKVKEFEGSLPSQQRLQNIRERIECLKKKKGELTEQGGEYDEVCNGRREEQVRTQIHQVKSSIDNIHLDVHLKEKKLLELKSQEKKLQLAITVLHKRNAAQLTRLKRQAREQHLRHGQWTEQQAHLQLSITQARAKLEE